MVAGRSRRGESAGRLDCEQYDDYRNARIGDYEVAVKTAARADKERLPIVRHHALARTHQLGDALLW